MQTEFQKSMQHLFLFRENQCNTCSCFVKINATPARFSGKCLNTWRKRHFPNEKSMQHYMWQHKKQCNTTCGNTKINATLAAPTQKPMQQSGFP